MTIARRRLVPAVLVLTLAVSALTDTAMAQTFDKIVDTENPVVTQGGGPGGSFIGSAWVDTDQDGDLDLFIVRNGLFRNDGGGVFSRLPSAIISQGLATGCTWGDIDNDGDLDVFVAGGTPSGSAMYRNLGGNQFAKLTTGVLADTATHFGWAAAFGDYDRDGNLDLALAAPIGFNGVTGPNRLLHGLGGGAFERVDSSAVAGSLAFYTVPSWSDFDDDGDIDLFFGTGSGGGALGPDWIFRNRHESQPGRFERYTAAPLATDLHDGQVYTWIDYDNDGDLDAYLTNFGGNVNDLYANLGGGVFVQRTAAEVGPIVSDIQPSLASVWQDFDNDGDLDCYVTNAQTFVAKFYRNDGALFTPVPMGALTGPGPHWGASAGDYDNDGLVDLYVNGTAATHGLFRNTTAAAGHWLRVTLSGAASNRSAIGARVRLKAVIGGTPRWQMREVSAQNSFDGMNMLDSHFGLGDATVADSVVIEWPNGARSVRVQVPADAVLLMSEADGTTDVPGHAPLALAILSVGGNPGRGAIPVRFSVPLDGEARVELIDASGRRIDARRSAAGAPGVRHLMLAESLLLAPGLYLVRLHQGGRSVTTKVARMR